MVLERGRKAGKRGGENGRRREMEKMDSGTHLSIRFLHAWKNGNRCKVEPDFSGFCSRNGGFCFPLVCCAVAQLFAYSCHHVSCHVFMCHALCTHARTGGMLYLPRDEALHYYQYQYSKCESTAFYRITAMLPTVFI